MTTRPRASAHTWPGPRSSDLKPSASDTSTTLAKIRKLRSRSDLAAVSAGATFSIRTGGSFMAYCSRILDTAVPVFQPNNVIDLGRGHLKDVGVFDRGEAVARARREVHGVPGAHSMGGQLAVGAPDLHVDAALDEVLPLVLSFVVLEGQRLPLV